jgi:hypothetical protein
MDNEFFMVYAEGQNTPTYKHEDEEKATKEAKRLSEKLGVETIVLKSVASVIVPKDITERVQSYEDACKVLSIEPENETVLTKLGFTKDEIAYRKIKTIAQALNEGWEPNWSDSNEYKYYNWFYKKTNGAAAGFASALTHYAASSANTAIGSRLCFKSRDLATYAGQKFTSLYNDFLLINK